MKVRVAYASGNASLIPAAVFLFSGAVSCRVSLAKSRQSAPVPPRCFPRSALSVLALLLSIAAVAVPTLADRPWLLFGFVFLQYVQIGACAWNEGRLLTACAAAGAVVFILLGSWSMRALTHGLLPWAIGLYLGFGILQSAVPLMWHRRRKAGEQLLEASLWMPLLVLVLLLLAIVRVPESSTGIWGAVLVVNVMMLVVGGVSRRSTPVAAGFLLTMLTCGLWLAAICNRDTLRETMAGPFLGVVSGFLAS